jgi:3-mercaptopyruvate sulfurtransferase SseA
MTSYLMPEMQTDEEFAAMLRELGITEDEIKIFCDFFNAMKQAKNGHAASTYDRRSHL